MGGLRLSFHSQKLLVTGSTYDARDVLKSVGGRWAPELKGWVFPADSKQRLLGELRSSGAAANVQDSARVRLSLDRCDKGHLVTGETFPVRELLKEKGGRWDPHLGGWVFTASLDAARLAGELLISGHVSGVGRRKTAAAALPAAPAACATPDRGRAPAPARTGGTGEKASAALPSQVARRGAAPAQQPGRGLAKASGGFKVVEVGKQQRSVKTGADGSRTEVKTEKRERRITGKRPGTAIETRSVTKKKKVIETKDQIVETATITVRRVRKK